METREVHFIMVFECLLVHKIECQQKRGNAALPDLRFSLAKKQGPPIRATNDWRAYRNAIRIRGLICIERLDYPGRGRTGLDAYDIDRGQSSIHRSKADPLISNHPVDSVPRCPLHAVPIQLDFIR